MIKWQKKNVYSHRMAHFPVLKCLPDLEDIGCELERHRTCWVSVLQAFGLISH